MKKRLGYPRIRLLEQVATKWFYRNLKIPDGKFKIDQKMPIFDFRAHSCRTYPVYF